MLMLGRMVLGFVLAWGLGCAGSVSVLDGDAGGSGDGGGHAGDGVAHDTAAAHDTAHAGAALGVPCTADGDCAGDKCLPIAPGADSVCSAPCTTGADCAAAAGFFCGPTAVGLPSGFCRPPSPIHCMPCQTDADCGDLADACLKAPGDPTLACHVDCSLDPAACPSDYTCSAIDVAGATRHLCTPTAPATCADAQGGFCDRVTTAQPCSRASDAGSCSGQRTCQATSGRLSACSAAVPACKPTCATPDPTGCQEVACAGVATTPENCGTCGHACPGAGQATAVVGCSAPNCTFACVGESYDVNNDPTDGCEVTDVPTGNHAQATATDLGSKPCDDGSSNPGIAGSMPSDQRTHQDPAVPAIDTTTHAAPDWYVIHASGGTLCQDDINFTFTVTGSSQPVCYLMKVTTNVSTYSCQASTSGTCSIAPGMSSYGDGSDVYVVISKTCAGAPYEHPTYAVTGHM
jgi:hypothetical protein